MSATSVANQGQGVDVGVVERPHFVGGVREVALSNLLWDAFLNVRGEGGRKGFAADQADHSEPHCLSCSCGSRES